MNKTWLNLIIIGVIILVAAVVWEFYQDSTGYRSKIDITIIEYDQANLLNPKVEKHVTSDPEFGK